MHPSASPSVPRARRRSRALVAPLLVLVVAACTREPSRSIRPPNVLLISLDSTRPDHLGCYGYRSRTGAPTSPHVDRLASEGILFEHAVSTTSWTMPSHHALLSGLFDLVHGAVSDEGGPTPQRVQLAQVLSDAGYATAGYFSGPYLDPRYGFGGGFDVYENASGVEEPAPSSSANGGGAGANGGGSDANGGGSGANGAAGNQGAVGRAIAELETSYHRASSAKRVSDAGIAWLDRRRAEQPFFLFLHYFDVHYDYAPPEEGYARRFWPDGRRPRLNGDSFFENPEIRPGMDGDDLGGVISYYDGEILWTDEQVGRVLDRLAALKVADDTLVVVVSDHGDEFFEHGAKGHRQNLFEPTLDVALIARLPGRLPAGLRIAPRVSIVDVAPTILDLAGELAKADFHAPDVPAAPPGSPRSLDHGMFGRSLLPLVEGRERTDRDCLAFLANRWQDKDHPVDTWALWTGPMKAIVTRRYDWVDSEGTGRRLVARETTGQLFDLSRDPREQHDLSTTPDAAIRAVLDRFDATFSDRSELSRLAAALPAGPPPPPLTPTQITWLAQLGYAAPPSPPPLPPGTKLSQVLPPPPTFPRPH